MTAKTAEHREKVMFKYAKIRAFDISESYVVIGSDYGDVLVARRSDDGCVNEALIVGLGVLI